MEIKNKALSALQYIQRYGILGFTNKIYYLSSDRFYEKYFAVSTAGEMSKDTLNLDYADCNEYSSVHYRNIFWAIKKLRIDYSKSVLLDYGCGKGRSLIVGSSLGFKKLIGIEITQLANIASDNLINMNFAKSNLFEIKKEDANFFDVPEDVNVIYFFNPFIGKVLENVIERICHSLIENPRKIYIIFFNNDHFDRAIKGFDWINKLEQFSVYNHTSCGVYEANK